MKQYLWIEPNIPHYATSILILKEEAHYESKSHYIVLRGSDAQQQWDIMLLDEWQNMTARLSVPYLGAPWNEEQAREFAVIFSRFCRHLALDDTVE